MVDVINNDTNLNLVNIIQNVATSLHIIIAQKDLEVMKKWDISALRKKLGDLNRKKKLMNSPPQVKFDHDQQHQHLLQQEVAQPYEGQGLNAAAVSTSLQPQETVVKNKPPQVVEVETQI